MKIIVTYENAIFGNGLHWEGDATKIHEIPNIPARLTAEKVVKDGKKRVCGMWHVSVVK